MAKRGRRKFAAKTIFFAGAMAWLALVSLVRRPSAEHASVGTGDSDREEPTAFESNGGVVLEMFGVLYTFLALAIICDDYFVASLEVICEKLSLSEDVAGASFMAVGSSAPELFTSLAANLVGPVSDVGVGTIVGSAIFNVLVIIGISGIMSPRPLILDPRPLLRDCIAYGICVAFLIGFVLNQRVYLAESVFLVVLYVFYLIFLGQNKKIMEKFFPDKSSAVTSAGETEMGIVHATDEEIDDTTQTKDGVITKR